MTKPTSTQQSPQESVSDSISKYLEAIFYMTAEGESVRASRLAEWLGVSRPTVASALKRMEKSGLCTTNTTKQILLTPNGKSHAESIVRRHRIAERWLVDILKFDWLLADEEASRIEHGMTDQVADRLFEVLGRPTTCPHGNPIPGTTNHKTSSDERQLSTLKPGENAVLLRVSEVAEHDAPELLRFLADHKFHVSSAIDVIDVSGGAGTITITVDGQIVSMSINAASKLWVQS
jgi:DtxR family Mn-dependent transcriptional regulator